MPPWLRDVSNDPSWTDIVTAISSAVAALGLVAATIGAWLVYRQVRETRHDRHVQVLSDFGRRWDDDHLAKARVEVLQYTSEGLVTEIEKWQKLSRRDPDSAVPVLLRVPNFFEDLALTVECGELELKLVERSFGSIAIREWGHWELAIDNMRESQPDAYQEFRGLVQLVKELRAAENR